MRSGLLFSSENPDMIQSPAQGCGCAAAVATLGNASYFRSLPQRRCFFFQWSQRRPASGQPTPRAKGRCAVGAWTDGESCIGEPAARKAYEATFLKAGKQLLSKRLPH